MFKLKKFKGWLPVPVLPAAQVAATSYAQQLAYLEWYVDYLAGVISAEGVPQTVGTAKLVDTNNVERGSLDYVITGNVITATVHVSETFVTTDLGLKVVGLPENVHFAGNISQQSFAVNKYITADSLMRIFRLFVVHTKAGGVHNDQIGIQDSLNSLYASGLVNADGYTFTARVETALE